MDALSLIKEEIIKPLLTLFLPGIFITFPIYLGLLSSTSSEFFPSNLNQLTIIILFVLSLGVGFILEDIGSRFELGLRARFKEKNKIELHTISGEYCIPKTDITKALKSGSNKHIILSQDLEYYQLNPKTPEEVGRDFDSAFKEYLNLNNNSDNKKIGVNYINSIVIRMKFELGMLASLIIGTPIWIYILKYDFCMQRNNIALFSLIISVIFAYLLYESYGSVALLHILREKILKREYRQYNTHLHCYVFSSFLICIFFFLTASTLPYSSFCIYSPSSNIKYLANQKMLLQGVAVNIDKLSIYTDDVSTKDITINSSSNEKNIRYNLRESIPGFPKGEHILSIKTVKNSKFLPFFNHNYNVNLSVVKDN